MTAPTAIAQVVAPRTSPETVETPDTAASAGPVTAVALNARATATRVHWVALGSNLEFVTGSVKGKCLSTAHLAAFEAALNAFDMAPGAAIYSGHREFADTLVSLQATFPNLVFPEYSEATSRGRLMRFSWKLVSEATGRTKPSTPVNAPIHVLAEGTGKAPLTRRPRSEERMTIATDGSFGGFGGPRGAWAWISEDGVAVSGHGGRDILDAELLAITSALANVHPRQPLRIISDSRTALECIDRGEGHPMAHVIKRHLRGRDVIFEWVRGHNGDILNEAADRLAVQTRRHHQGFGDLGVLHENAMRILSEVAEQIGGDENWTPVSA